MRLAGPDRMSDTESATPTAGRKYLFVGVLALVLAVAFEGVARAVFVLVPTWERARLLLRGEIDLGPTGAAQYSVGQAYLLYIPSPNFHNETGLSHNAHGYRGKALPQARRPRVARILFLGGSTTYGWGVPDSEQTHPAHIERLLNAQPPAGFDSVEVINAGIPWGTTAEMLTHYHFKFHFYHPDLVVLNPGGNDAQGLIAPYYHPDSSNWRQPLIPAQPAAPRARRLLQSRLVALFLVPILYDPYPDSKFVNYDGRPPLAPWYDRATPNPERAVPNVPRDEIAFSHNMNALVDEIQKDGHTILLVPFRLHPKAPYGDGMKAAIALEEEILTDLGRSRGIAVAPFPASVVSDSNWLDTCCHLTGAGNLEKARHMLPYVRAALEAPHDGAAIDGGRRTTVP
jgi:lysophospholipase L1-like esterase